MLWHRRALWSLILITPTYLPAFILIAVSASNFIIGLLMIAGGICTLSCHLCSMKRDSVQRQEQKLMQRLRGR